MYRSQPFPAIMPIQALQPRHSVLYSTYLMHLAYNYHTHIHIHTGTCSLSEKYVGYYTKDAKCPSSSLPTSFGPCVEPESSTKPECQVKSSEGLCFALSPRVPVVMRYQLSWASAVIDQGSGVSNMRNFSHMRLIIITKIKSSQAKDHASFKRSALLWDAAWKWKGLHP